MSAAKSSPHAVHNRWRLQACLRVLLFALPWNAVALLMAWRVAGQWNAWCIVAAALLATLAWLVHTWKKRDLHWLATTFNQHPSFEDSAGLLLGLDPTTSPLATLQHQRLLARWTSLDLEALQPRQRLAPVLWNLLASAGCAAVIWSWHRPLPETLRRQLPTAIAQVFGVQSPSLAAVLLDINPPAYTGLPATKVETLDARVPEISRVQWSLRFTAQPAQAWLQFENGPRMALIARDGQWQVAQRIERSGLYRIVTEPALPAAQRRLHRVDVIRDQPPQVRATTPAQSLTLRTSGQQRWPLVFEATDDYGIATNAELRIIQTSGDGENITSTQRTLPLSGTGPARARRFAYVFDLASSGLSVGNDVIVQLSVRDNRQPSPQTVRSASVILRWPPEQMGMATGLDGLVQQVLPAYFRSQRQIIIDAEKLIREKSGISAEVFAKRSDAIGVDQHALRLRYGQFLGEEEEGAKALPTSDADSPSADQHDDHAQPPPHVQGETGNAGVDAMLAEVSHVHDLPEAATLLDPETQAVLRAALREMWQSESELRLGQPQAALPFANKALRLIKQVQQADRIYLPKIGSELPPIDMARRLTGKRDGLTARSNGFTPLAEAPSPVDALWSALAPDHAAMPVPTGVLDAASRHLHARGSEDSHALAALAGMDALREEPACNECRERLRQRLWPLLPAPIARPVPRDRATSSGNAYLDALQPEVGQ
ncbi:MAG: hypothetical protein ABIO61_02185 [Thermomonas sp.]